jgi:hypothetical protein
LITTDVWARGLDVQQASCSWGHADWIMKCLFVMSCVFSCLVCLSVSFNVLGFIGFVSCQMLFV